MSASATHGGHKEQQYTAVCEICFAISGHL